MPPRMQIESPDGPFAIDRDCPVPRAEKLRLGRALEASCLAGDLGSVRVILHGVRPAVSDHAFIAGFRGAVQRGFEDVARYLHSIEPALLKAENFRALRPIAKIGRAKTDTHFGAFAAGAGFARKNERLAAWLLEEFWLPPDVFTLYWDGTLGDRSVSSWEDGPAREAARQLLERQVSSQTNKLLAGKPYSVRALADTLRRNNWLVRIVPEVQGIAADTLVEAGLVHYVFETLRCKPPGVLVSAATGTYYRAVLSRVAGQEGKIA